MPPSPNSNQTSLLKLFYMMTACCAAAAIFGSAYGQATGSGYSWSGFPITPLLAITFAISIGMLKEADFALMNIAFVFALLVWPITYMTFR